MSGNSINSVSSTGNGQVREILLVDDEPSVLFALKLLLQALGFEVRDFSLPEEALKFLSSGKSCDLFICDLKMPKMNGLAVLERAKQICPSIPFVLMSAHATDDEVAKAKGLGAFGFLAKPFTPEAIKDTIAQVAAHRSLEPKSPPPST